MDSRLLQALLYFLPGNLYQSPDNPLQLDRLEDTSGVELDYPVYQDSPASAARSFWIVVFMSSLAAPLLAWTTHLLPIPFLYGGLNTVALIVAGALIVYGILSRTWPLASLAAAAMAIPVLALLVRDVPYTLSALLVAIVGQLIFADFLVTSYLYFKTAAPFPRSRSQQIRKMWQRRFVNLWSPLYGSELYGLGFLVIVPAAWFVVGTVAATNSASPFWLVTLLFWMIAGLGIAAFAVAEAVAAALFGRKWFSAGASFAAMLRALICWSTYNRRNARGAGVHQMPAGRCASRRFFLIGLIAAWGCVWTGLQWIESQHPLLRMLERLQADPILWSSNFYGQHSIDADSLSDGFALSPKGTVVGQSSDTGSVPSSQRKPPELEPYEIEFLKRQSKEEQSKYLAKRSALEISKEEQAAASRSRNEFTQSPKNLLVRFFYSLGTILLNVLVPSLSVLLASGSLLFAMSARALAGIEALLGRTPHERVFRTENWENIVGRVRGSEDKIEKQSIILGVNSRDDTPVLVPRNVFIEHAHVMGDSGSGKTSIGLLPLVSQLIRFGDCSLIFIDLKADDQFILESLRIESSTLDRTLKSESADSPGFQLRWFTTVLDRSSYAFNPMTQRVMSKLDPDQRTDIITAALGLQYGTDYGRKYFGDANYDLLNYALRENPNIQSFSELEQILAGADRFMLPPETKKAATHVRSSVRRLARCLALNAGPNQHTPPTVLDHAIDLADFFSQPQALYVALPAAAGISSTAEIARIFLYSLLAAAQAHQGPRTRVVLVIDEFQRLVSKNIELFLQTARSMGIGCILSNQSLADLDTVDANLLPAVRTNTRIRQVFGAGYRDDIRDLIDTAGETVFADRSWNFVPGLFGTDLHGVTVKERLSSRLSINDVLLATDAPGRNVACVRRGEGYAQFGGMPFLMDSVYHISQPEYDRRKTASWPASSPETLVATMPDLSGAASPGTIRILGEPAPTSPAEENGDDLTELVETPVVTAPEVGPGTGEGILVDDPITALYLQQEAEREAVRRKRRSKQQK